MTRRDRKRLLADSRAKAEESRQVRARIEAQWPEVRAMTGDIARHERENHVRLRLRATFGQPRRRWRDRWA